MRKFLLPVLLALFATLSASLDAITGVIAGTPAQVSAPASYVVTGSNSAGSASAHIMIEVQSQIVVPASLQYSHTAPVYTVDEVITPNMPQSTGGEITQYSVTPALPAGSSLNATATCPACPRPNDTTLPVASGRWPLP